MSNPKIILFDFYDTLVEKNRDHALQYICKKFKIDSKIIDSNLDFFESLKVLQDIDREIHQKIINVLKKTSYLSLIEGSLNILQHLRSKQILTGIVSSLAHNDLISLVEYLNINQYFNIIVGGQDGLDIKPSPDQIFFAIKQIENQNPTIIFSINHQDIWLIGDSMVDIVAANNAKIKPIRFIKNIDNDKDIKNDNYDFISQWHDLLQYLQ